MTFFYTGNYNIYKIKTSTFKTILKKSFSKILVDFTEAGMITYYFDLNYKLKELV